MGPLLSGSGNRQAIRTGTKRKGALQWGRFSVEAEIIVCGSTETRYLWASMGPLLSGSGNAKVNIGAKMYQLRFNGAASQWKRKLKNTNFTDLVKWVLQWGRFSVVAEILRDYWQYPKQHRKLQWGRFSVEAEINIKLYSDWNKSDRLQWGRFSVQAEIHKRTKQYNSLCDASMGPLLSGSGNKLYLLWLWMYRRALQWGRFSVEAEMHLAYIVRIENDN